MAYAPNRSCNGDLFEGSTDGGYKKYAPHRGGFVETASAHVRRDMSGVWHGFNDKPEKASPCGMMVPDGHFVNVTPKDVENV